MIGLEHLQEGRSGRRRVYDPDGSPVSGAQILTTMVEMLDAMTRADLGDHSVGQTARILLNVDQGDSGESAEANRHLI